MDIGLQQDTAHREREAWMVLAAVGAAAHMNARQAIIHHPSDVYTVIMAPAEVVAALEDVEAQAERAAAQGAAPLASSRVAQVVCAYKYLHLPHSEEVQEVKVALAALAAREVAADWGAIKAAARDSLLMRRACRTSKTSKR